MSQNPNHYSFSHSNNILNTTNSNNTTINNYHTAKDDEQSKILSWISPLESWRRHSDIASIRAEGVGNWVLQTREFQAWRGGGNDAILFCRGAPGAGKTFIW
ncbi:hypothetical protein L873DRAFT_1800582 [Choiromyces venosus 120613-1]|uniref:Nephrocystin 3-like N-terminal domain-containing protein n=1 Tax=Choiromyces venosus 120613-1 TaxID=1336337 RepID=A0A3N4JYP0_9PEZI|nr:hypothetical protein L873DRAFT_1800582 [Choiromyces venosus 120613-1]